jgi:predicted unusual protein kinase regulating ubiquinone biosynthesis (AarF/ABC1/UbiB family)
MINLDYKINRTLAITKLGMNVLYMKNIAKAPIKEIGRVTRNGLSELGPTFIKIGQFMSTRSDIFGKEFTDQLMELQDKIAPFAIDASVLSSEVQLIEPPIATASIGQVYKGIIKKGGQTVAIKIKRPDIERDFTMDFQVFLFLLDIVTYIGNQREVGEFNILIHEYYKLLKEEIDFGREVQNMERFYSLFQKKKFVKIPRPVKQYCTNDVIVMEYIPSIRIDDLATMKQMGFNTRKIAQKLVDLFFDQILNYGVIHIDPHPGNVGITVEGKIVFYDYGMVQTINIDLKKNLKDILMALYDKNVDYICKLMIENEIIICADDQLPYLKNFVLSFLGYLNNMSINDFKTSYIDNVDKTSMPFAISSKFLLILRGMSILEGVCKTLDPSFSYTEVIERYIDTSMVDIAYMEKRALMDIDSMRVMPDNVAANKIRLEILQKNIQTMDSRVSTKMSRILTSLSGFVFIDIIDHTSPFKWLALVSTFLLLYK